jgi:hypothetical protein
MKTDWISNLHIWGQDSDWFWAFLQFVAVAWTLWYVAKQVRLQAMSHVVESICTLQDHWDSETMQRRRNEVCHQWTPKRAKDFDGACEHIADFFEELGTFVKNNAIPLEVVWDVHSWNIEHYWFMFKPGIVKERQDCQEEIYCEFERLFKTMRKLSDKKRLRSVDERDMVEFTKREIKKTNRKP